MKSNWKIYVFIIVVTVLIGAYVLINNSIKSNYTPNYNLRDFYVIPERRVEVNEYKVAKVQEKDMIYTYFNTFIAALYETPNESYELLNADYRKLKFGSLINYLEYVKKLTVDYTYVPKIKDYSISQTNNKIIYNIRDDKNNQYIFLIEGVMKYSIYFDENTIDLE